MKLSRLLITVPLAVAAALFCNAQEPAENAQEPTEVMQEPADSLPAPITGVQTLEIKVSPVDIDRDKPRQPGLHYYDKHGNELETPVRFLTELDTVTSVKSGPTYPLYNGVSVGVNIFDPIMMIAGQRRLSIDLHADVSLFNWFFPVIEAGIGYADANPDDGRCHIKQKPTFYGKVGFNYNFIYKSNPDYQVFLGFRAGFSDFTFSVTDIQAGSSYYDIAKGEDLNGIHASCWYGQLVAGIKVKIYKMFSMGWTGRYGFRFKTSTSREVVDPWFIPGYGSGPLTATYSLIFTI